MFALFFKPGEVAVCNMASSGRTAKSFIAEKRQESMFKTMKEGDYLFIQFSHNDMKDTTMTMDAWKTILMTYVDGARERKATPVFVTSIPRRQFDDQNKIKNSLGEFPQTMRDLAKEKQVALIDLNASATVFFNILGPEGTTKAYSHYPADMYTGHLAANADNTHLNPYGAYELAKLVAHEIQSSKLGLASHVVGNLEPQNPDPAKFPSSLNYNPLLIKK
jgi:lysophospholipase L1-like esterase